MTDRDHVPTHMTGDEERRYLTAGEQRVMHEALRRSTRLVPEDKPAAEANAERIEAIIDECRDLDTVAIARAIVEAFPELREPPP